MKRAVVLLGALVVVGALLTLPAGADDNVNVTVTPLVLAVSVSPDTVPYGNVALSPANDDRRTAVSPTITATNDSSVLADFNIRGANATADVLGQTDWTINCSPTSTGTVGANQFVHRFGIGNPDFNAVGQALCSGTSASLATDVALLGTTDFKLQMNMPTSMTGYGQRSTTVTVIVVAATP